MTGFIALCLFYVKSQFIVNKQYIIDENYGTLSSFYHQFYDNNNVLFGIY